MSQIHENSTVTLHFSLKLEDGHVVDSTFEKQPATLAIGDGNLPESFEKYLLGLSVGDHRVVRVGPEDAFGQVNPDNIHLYNSDQFALTGAIEMGMVVYFEDALGQESPGVITDIDEDEITVDFNHPLAGKSLDFEVEIISVEASSHGH